jgi:prophage regulatory protein
MSKTLSNVQAEAPLALLRLPEVLERTGLSVSEIYRRIAQKTFPAPVKLGLRASAWASTEVDAWVRELIEVRDRAERSHAAR